MTPTWRRTALLTTVVLATVLSACGSGPSPSAPADAPAADTAFPVTITHALGETTIEERPERIVALSNEDDLLGQLGIPVVGHKDNISRPGELYPWQVGVVDHSGSTVVEGVGGELNYELIASLAPDLILATDRSFAIGDEYATLSAIAPTVAHNEDRPSWQDASRVIGRAVGREADTAAVVADVEAGLAAVAAELPGLQGRTSAGAYYYESGMFTSTFVPTAPSNRLLAGFGLVPNTAFYDAVAAGNRLLSIEQVGLLDSDYIVVSFATPALRDELLANPLFTGLPAVRDGRVTLLDGEGAKASNGATSLNVPWSVEQRRPAFERVDAMAGP